MRKIKKTDGINTRFLVWSWWLVLAIPIIAMVCLITDFGFSVTLGSSTFDITNNMLMSFILLAWIITIIVLVVSVIIEHILTRLRKSKRDRMRELD